MARDLNNLVSVRVTIATLKKSLKENKSVYGTPIDINRRNEIQKELAFLERINKEKMTTLKENKIKYLGLESIKVMISALKWELKNNKKKYSLNELTIDERIFKENKMKMLKERLAELEHKNSYA